jgi:hypothetical protein
MEGIAGVLSDKLGSILTGWATLPIIVLATVEALGQAARLKDRKMMMSMILGPLFGYAAYWIGLVDVPLHGAFAPVDDTDEIRHVAGAAFLGFSSTMIAKVVHDIGIVGTLKAAAVAALGKRTSTNGGN